MDPWRLAAASVAVAAGAFRGRGKDTEQILAHQPVEDRGQSAEEPAGPVAAVSADLLLARAPRPDAGVDAHSTTHPGSLAPYKHSNRLASSRTKPICRPFFIAAIPWNKHASVAIGAGFSAP